VENILVHFLKEFFSQNFVERGEVGCDFCVIG